MTPGMAATKTLPLPSYWDRDTHFSRAAARENLYGMSISRGSPYEGVFRYLGSSSCARRGPYNFSEPSVMHRNKYITG